ncbi:MAG: FAD binding domain-containing protein [Atopobiaceae bacterium]|nr:FAD binding domain-containing protein [Atopobiaceae bacterium]
MKAAGYVTPATLAEAAAARADGGIVIAGGTDVMVKGRARGVYAGRTLIDVSRLEELRQVRERDGAVEIGAACTLAELCGSALIAEKLPLLADACAHVGGVQIRNRATIGGNVVNACPASDVIPALMVLGACVRTTARELPLDGLFRACPACLRHEGMLVRTCYFPDAAAKKTVLEPDELVVSLVVPVPADGTRWLFHKLTRTQGIGLARLNVALLEPVPNGAIAASMGGLFSKPCVLRVSSPEDARTQLAEKIAAECSSLVDYDYKSRVAPALLADAIAALQAGETLERKRRA